MSERTTPAPVALLGAGGTMGFGMACNIAQAGLPLRAWNRSREKAQALAEHGAHVVDTPAQAAAGAAVLITMLSDADAVLDAMTGESGALAAPRQRPPIWAQMSTIGVAGTEWCAELADRRGVVFVDAPVLGTKQPAHAGELIVMASGPEQVRAVLDPVFAAISSKVMWLGPAGAGMRLKLVTNSWILAVVEAAAETIALAEGAGVDPRSFLKAISGGPLDLPYLRMKAEAMLERDFEPSFRLRLAAKDASLVGELGDRCGMTLPLLATIEERLFAAVPAHGDQDMAATFLTSAPA